MRTTLKSWALVLALCGVTSVEAPASLSIQHDEWISLYLGREAQFQESLTQKIKTLCDSYGVPYQITADNLIMVPIKARPSLLLLIASSYKK